MTTNVAINKLKGFVFSFVGTCLLLGGIASGIFRYNFISSASVADGVVTKLNAGGSHPEIEFTTAAGEKVSYPQGGFIGGYSVGDNVKVLYDVESPRQAVVNDNGALWDVPVFLTFMGVVFVCAGFYCFRYAPEK